MSRFLFTMLPVDDLGLPTRLVPVARLLAERCAAQIFRWAAEVTENAGRLACCADG